MRYLGYLTDPTAGGTTFDDIVAGAIADPTEFVPVTTAQVDPGVGQVDRNDEVRGRRANSAPISFSSTPSLTLGARAYPKLVRAIVRNALGGSISSTGVPPAAVDSTVGPLQSGNLPALIAWLVREGQIDRLTGLVVEEFTLDFPIDGEGTIEATLQGLYHDVDPATAIVEPAPVYADYDDTYMLRDLTAIMGDGAGVEIDCLAGFGLTYNNGLIDDARSRFCAGKNVQETVLDGQTHRVWYPNQHKLGPQQVSGRLDFGDVRPDRELRRILTHAEKLVVEVAAGPLGTTPDADDMMRWTLYKQAPTGGGAEPLQREGDQVSSYEFTAYIDESLSKDVEATFTGDAALV
jgi:hypothetical protein